MSPEKKNLKVSFIEVYPGFLKPDVRAPYREE
jgi:hypothetical protein